MCVCVCIYIYIYVDNTMEATEEGSSRNILLNV